MFVSYHSRFAQLFYLVNTDDMFKNEPDGKGPDNGSFFLQINCILSVEVQEY